MDFRRGDQAFWHAISEHPLDPRIQELVRIAGFSGVLECGYRKIDRGLISALVERWRPETHTFHLRIGEATVTLQDVNVLMGLRVNGATVSGPEFSMRDDAERVEYVKEILGVESEPRKFRGNTLESSIIVEKIKAPLPADANEGDIT